MLRVHVESLAVMSRLYATLCQQEQSFRIVMNSEQLFGQRPCLREVSRLEIRLEKIAQSFRMRIQIGGLLQEPDCLLRLVGFERRASAHQQHVTVTRIERQHA